MQHKEDMFITIPELAKIIGLSRSQTFRKVKSGEIPAQRAGRIFLIPRSYADNFTDKLTESDEKIISEGVNRVIEEYGEVIRKLGDS